MRTHWAFYLLLATSTLQITACGSPGSRRGAVCQNNANCTGGPCIAYECVALAACTIDSDCTKGICNKGYCYGTECSKDKPCGVGYVCHEKGYCVQDPTGQEESDVSISDVSIDAGDVGETQTTDAGECQVAGDCAGKVANLTQCQHAACNNGKCEAANEPKDTACTHPNACTSVGKCDDAGVCQPGANTCDCEKDADCQGKGVDDACNKAVCSTGKKCVKQPDPAKVGGDCSDGNACTTGETCNAKGECVGGSNPCITDGKNPCQEGAVCAPTGVTTYSCAYVQKPCDDGNICNNSECNTTTGVCDPGQPKPFATDCAIIGATGPTMCGIFGRCREVALASVPEGGKVRRFESTCWPGGDEKMYALVTAKLGGGCTAGYDVYELDFAKTTSKGSVEWANSCNITPVCHRDVVYARSNDNGFETMRFRPATKIWDLESESDITDPQLKQFVALAKEYENNDGRIDVLTIKRLGATTFLAGRLAKTGITQLVRCTDQACLGYDQSLGSASGYWYTTQMVAGTFGNEEMVAMLSVDYSDFGGAPTQGAWRLSSWNAEFKLSCDGSDPASACYSPFAWPGPGDTVDTAYWQYSNTGFHDITGYDPNALYVVGESRWSKMVGFNVPFKFPRSCFNASQATDCESGICENDLGNGGTCKGSSSRTIGRLLRYNGTDWAEVTSKPTLVEPKGSATLVDYVYSKVTTVQLGTAVVISGFYRACFGKCTTAVTSDEYTTLQAQAFLVTYYPASDTWSKMQLLGSPLQRRCCFGGTCASVQTVPNDVNSPWTPRSCNTVLKQTRFLDRYPVALDFRRIATDGSMYFLANPITSKICSVNSDCTGIGIAQCVGVVPGQFNAGWCAANGQTDATYYYFKPL